MSSLPALFRHDNTKPVALPAVSSGAKSRDLALLQGLKGALRPQMLPATADRSILLLKMRKTESQFMSDSDCGSPATMCFATHSSANLALSVTRA